MVEAQKKKQKFHKLNMKSKVGLSTSLVDKKLVEMELNSRDDFTNHRKVSLATFLKILAGAVLFP